MIAWVKFGASQQCCMDLLRGRERSLSFYVFLEGGYFPVFCERKKVPVDVSFVKIVVEHVLRVKRQFDQRQKPSQGSITDSGGSLPIVWPCRLRRRFHPVRPRSHLSPELALRRRCRNRGPQRHPPHHHRMLPPPLHQSFRLPPRRSHPTAQRHQLDRCRTHPRGGAESGASGSRFFS